MERSNQTALFRLAALFLVTLFASAVLQFDCAVAQTALPDGCAFKPSGNTAYYFCAGSGLWLMPAYGANGLYYRAVAAP